MGLLQAYYGVAQEGEKQFVYVVPAEDIDEEPQVKFCDEIVSCHRADVGSAGGYARNMAKMRGLLLVNYVTNETLSAV